MRKVMVIGLVGVLSLLVTACGQPEAEDGSAGAPGAPGATPGDPDDPVSSTPLPGGDPGDPRGMRVVPQEGLVDVIPHSFEEARPVASGDALEISFWDGIEECGGVDHIRVEYGRDTVTVSLFTGRNPEAEICTEQAVYKVVTVELEEPLDGRRIVDGAGGG